MTTSVGAGGQSGTRGKHLSGFLLATRTKYCLLRRRQGVSSRPYPRRNQRLMIPIGPVWPPGTKSTWPLRRSISQKTKVLPILHFAFFNLQFVFSFLAPRYSRFTIHSPGSLHFVIFPLCSLLYALCFFPFDTQILTSAGQQW